MSDRLKSLLSQFKVKDGALAARIAELENAKDASGNPRAPTEAELAEIKAAEDEVQRLSDSVETEMKADARRAAMLKAETEAAAPAAKDITGTIGTIARAGVPATTVPAAPKTLTPTLKFSVFLKGVMMEHHNPRLSIEDHIKGFGFEQLADEWNTSLATENKTLSSLSSAAGGYSIPTVLSSEFIQWLYPQSVFLAGNPTRVDLSSGNLNITGGNASATASYRAENAVLTYADATLRQVSLAAKNLAAVTAMTNELIMRSPMMIDTFVQGDLRRAFLLQMDLSLQRGDGTSNTPTGIRNTVSSTYRIAAVSDIAPDAQSIDDELKRMLVLVMNSNMPMDRPAWQMAPRTLLYMESLRNPDGSKAYPNLSITGGTLKGIPIIVSTQLPINLGTGTDESEISLTNFGHVLFGDTQAMTLDVSREASYDVSGTLKSAFAQNQTVFRLVGSHDVNVRYNPACTTLTAVRWGA